MKNQENPSPALDRGIESEQILEDLGNSSDRREHA
jgi:hypothetical protein